MKGHLDTEQLKSMKREELQTLAKQLNVSAGGKNKEIIARIVAVKVDVPEAEEMKEGACHAVATSQQGETIAAEMLRQEEDQPEDKDVGDPEGVGVLKEDGLEKRAEIAEMVTVRVIENFMDKKNSNQIRDAGEVYEVSRERAKELVAAGVAEIRE